MEVSGHHLQMALQIMLVMNMLVTIMKSTKVSRRCIMRVNTREIRMRVHEKYACSTDTHAVEIRSREQ